jgi:uncharacterized protein YqhQ
LERKCANVGGQAVIEGVMMRGPGSLAIAVRRPDGTIALKEAPWHSIWNRLKFLRWPFFRGTVVMVEAMINGMQALSFSARDAMPEEERKETGKGSGSGAAVALPMLLSLVVAVGLFKLLPHLAATHLGTLLRGSPLTVDEVLYHVIDGAVKIGIFVGYVFAIGLMADIRRVFMYHGAEHQSIYTYEAGEDLVVENARRKSPLHPRCGTAFLMVVILVFIVVAAVLMPLAPEWAKPGPGKPWATHLLLVLLKLPLLLPVAGVAYEFNRFAGRHLDSPWLRPLLWPGLAMQLLTTRKPTDDQLEIALVSLRTALWREAVGQEAREEEDRDEPLVFENFAAFETGLAALESARPEITA